MFKDGKVGDRVQYLRSDLSSSSLPFGVVLAVEQMDISSVGQKPFYEARYLVALPEGDRDGGTLRIVTANEAELERPFQEVAERLAYDLEALSRIAARLGRMVAPILWGRRGEWVAKAVQQ